MEGIVGCILYMLRTKQTFQQQTKVIYPYGPKKTSVISIRGFIEKFSIFWDSNNTNLSTTAVTSLSICCIRCNSSAWWSFAWVVRGWGDLKFYCICKAKPSVMPFTKRFTSVRQRPKNTDSFWGFIDKFSLFWTEVKHYLCVHRFDD